MTLSTTLFMAASNFGNGPFVSVSSLKTPSNSLVKNFAQSASQSTVCAIFPSQVVTWKPNLPSGEALARCSSATFAAS